METTIVYWGFIGIMDKSMETTMCLDSDFPQVKDISSSRLGEEGGRSV